MQGMPDKSHRPIKAGVGGTLGSLAPYYGVRRHAGRAC